MKQGALSAVVLAGLMLGMSGCCGPRSCKPSAVGEAPRAFASNRTYNPMSGNWERPWPYGPNVGKAPQECPVPEVAYPIGEIQICGQ